MLVLSQNGNISDFVLYALGLRDYDEFDNIINQVMSGKNVESPEYLEDYSYEDILGITF